MRVCNCIVNNAENGKRFFSLSKDHISQMILKVYTCQLYCGFDQTAVLGKHDPFTALHTYFLRGGLVEKNLGRTGKKEPNTTVAARLTNCIDFLLKS